MPSLNRAQIMGHLGQDPVARYMPTGECVTNISVATTDSWKDKSTGEKKQQTEWHRITFFGKLAEIARDFLEKGSAVFIEGSIKTRKYKDEKSGQDRYVTEIKGDSLQMLGAKPESSTGDDHRYKKENPPPRAQQQAAPPAKRATTEHRDFSDMDDDIPF